MFLTNFLKMMRLPNILVFIIFVLMSVTCFTSVKLFLQLEKVKKMITFQNISDEVSKALEYYDKKAQLVSFLKVNNASDKDGPLKLIRHGRDNDGGYVAAEKALATADILLGYGIADDISFEEQFSKKYNKQSFGFDCGIENIKSTQKLFTFVRECIGNDNFLYQDQKSSQKVTSFAQQFNYLGLQDKKLFIKMDIEGAEYEALPEILENSNNIAGIVLEIHFDEKNIDKAINLLEKLQKNFLLVHVHGNNCGLEQYRFATKNSIGKLTNLLELSYINKSLVTNYEISSNQIHPTSLDQPNCPAKSEVSFQVIAN